MKLVLNEKAQLEGLARNDKEVIEAIYKAHYNMIQSLIINNNGNYDDAKDIFQETMIVLYEKSRSGNFELNCQLKTYIYSVARRLWLKKLNQLQRYAGDIGNISDTAPVEDDLEQHDQQNTDFNMMEKAMSGLGEPCKTSAGGILPSEKDNDRYSCSVWIYKCRQCQESEIQMPGPVKKIIFCPI